jgi:hypothetical protein
MNFKQTRQDVDTVCFMVKKHIKTHSVQMFSRPPKTILQIWPTDISLQSVNLLMVNGYANNNKQKLTQNVIK